MRLRSPCAPSMRPTGGQYFARRNDATGYAARARGVGVLPLVGSDLLGRVGRVRQRVVGAIERAARDLVDLVTDRDHGVAEPIELLEVLALGRLDHQRAGDRERHRRRVDAVVDEPLRHVVDAHAGLLGDRPQVEDALVRDEARVARVQDGVVGREASGDVVRVQDRDLRRGAQARRVPWPACRPTGS